MAPLDTFLAAAAPGRDWKVSGGQYVCRCPVHEDKRPSLGVRVAHDGKLLVRCYAGCATDDILEALGLEYADLYPERAASW